MTKNNRCLLALVLGVTLLTTGLAAADSYNPFIGKRQAEKVQGPQKKTGGLPLTAPPPLPPVAPSAVVPMAQPVSGMIGPNGQPSHMAQNRFRILGMVDNRVSVTDDTGNVFLVSDGDLLGGCSVKYPIIDCSTTTGAGYRISKQTPDIPVHVPTQSPTPVHPMAKPPTTATPAAAQSPTWFPAAKAVVFQEVNLGKFEAIQKDGNIVALKVSLDQMSTAENLLKRYIQDRKVTTDAAYYHLSGLTTKGDSNGAH